jgi:hypothetical protein
VSSSSFELVQFCEQGHPPSCHHSHRGHLNADSSLPTASDPVATSKSCATVHHCRATHKPAASAPSMHRCRRPLLQAVVEGTSPQTAHLRSRAVPVWPPWASQQPLTASQPTQRPWWPCVRAITVVPFWNLSPPPPPHGELLLPPMLARPAWLAWLVVAWCEQYPLSFSNGI